MKPNYEFYSLLFVAVVLVVIAAIPPYTGRTVVFLIAAAVFLFSAYGSHVTRK